MINSLTNARIKQVRRLQEKRRFRHREGVFVVEGTRWIGDGVEQGVPFVELFYTAVWQAQNRPLFDQFSARSTLVTDEVMAVMSDMDSSPGVLATVRIRPLSIPNSPIRLLILDAITTPGNLGTILRTAAAAGVDGVILAPGCVDAYNPKVLRGSMGAHFRLPVQAMGWVDIQKLTAGMGVWLADIEGDVVYTAVDWQRPSVLIIGNEANGAGEAAQAMAMGRVIIPMHAATESLNAAMAAGIVLFEAARQQSDRNR